MTLKKILLSIMLFSSLFICAQVPDTYENAYNFINKMLEDEIPLNFKNAVFATENAYFDGNSDIEVLNQEIEMLVQLTNIISNTELITYQGRDKDLVTKHAAIFKVMTDTHAVPLDSIHIFLLEPYIYDFDDPTGQKDWTKMFVSKLLETGKGNCHSLPYLYKMLADELEIPCYLAFAPNHIYIKSYAESTGWYNTELTSATFPIDAWIIASGYVTIDAIRNGLYMDTLSHKQAVAHCLVDLAQGYQHKYRKEKTEFPKKIDLVQFVIKCCNTVLKYHPTNVNALLTKAEAQKHYIYSLMEAKNLKKPEDLFSDPSVKDMYAEMESIYILLHKWGYRQMPEEMYLQWMGLLKNDPSIYINQQLMIP